MNKIFRIDILTPYGKYLSTDAEFLSVLTSKGVVGILPNHAEMVTIVEISKLTIVRGNEKLIYAVSGGLMHIKENTHVVLLVNAIENKDEINEERAKKSKERALQRINEKSKEINIVRAKASLARALNRLSLLDKTDI